MSGWKDALGESPWRNKLMDVLKRKDKEGLAALSKIAHNELLSRELLSRSSERNTVFSTKMSAAGDDPIGF